MNILFVSPEVSPFARAGGLGDESQHLPRALADRGHQVRVITPRHGQVSETAHASLEHRCDLKVPLLWKDEKAEIYSCLVDGGVEVFLVGSDDLFNRNGIYGNELGDYEDNAERFIFFSRSVLEFIREFNPAPDVIHCHDWASGLVPVYMKTLYNDLPSLQKTASVFTYHNLGSQGVFWHYDFAMTGLGWEHFTPDGLEFHGRINMTKAGMVFADLITTVSPQYARETLTPEYGNGLEGVLAARRNDTFAVLSGVDYKLWDPEKDNLIATNYTPSNPGRKSGCRDDLTGICRLESDDRPIVAVVSRLSDRKGFDLVQKAIKDLLKLDLKMVFMGTGEDKYQTMLEDLARNHPGRVEVKITYDPELLHKIIAGADIFLMPSRYEPCGLEQLYALKYGTVPVVRATGSLDDTVVDVLRNPTRGTGFKFKDYLPEALCETLAAAVDMFRAKDTWTALMQRGMRQDFSWERAAADYENIYRKAVGRVERD